MLCLENEWHHEIYAYRLSTYFALFTFRHGHYHCVHGQVTVKTEGGDEILNEGESILIPACIDKVVLIPMKYTELLEIYMELGESKPRTYDDYDLDAAQRNSTGKFDCDRNSCDEDCNNNACSEKQYVC